MAYETAGVQGGADHTLLVDDTPSGLVPTTKLITGAEGVSVPIGATSVSSDPTAALSVAQVRSGAGGGALINRTDSSGYAAGDCVGDWSTFIYETWTIVPMGVRIIDEEKLIEGVRIWIWLDSNGSTPPPAAVDHTPFDLTLAQLNNCFMLMDFETADFHDYPSLRHAAKPVTIPMIIEARYDAYVLCEALDPTAGSTEPYGLQLMGERASSDSFGTV